jgi:hypothetical protein
MSGGELYVLALQIGLGYLLPGAALLRAIYMGLRGRLPEGLRDIAIAAFIAGLGSIMDGDAEDLGQALFEVVGNAVFVGGVLTFTLVYLLKLPNLGPWVDGIIGGSLGFIVWIVSVYIFNNPWPTWSGPLTAVAGAMIFIGLRSLIRRMADLLRLARRLILVGGVLGVIGVGLWLLTAG